MTRPNPSGDRTADAVECFLCLVDPDADPALRARWTAWLGESAENRAAYHAVRDTWNRPVPADVWPTHEQIINDTYDSTGPIPTKAAGPRLGTGKPTGRTRRSPKSPALMLIAGALLVAAIVVGWRQTRLPTQASSDGLVYQTGRGEQRRIALADGSAITLGPLSTLSIIADATGRSVRLDRGEAIFAITRNPEQPFKLFANGGEITDIGTTFGVEIRADRATVTVVEGAVRVSPRIPRTAAVSVDLNHDEQVSFSQDLGPVDKVDGRAKTDWSRGRLAYLDQPLADVVADLTRYTTRDIVIGDPAAGVLHYTGTIEADAIDQWVAALTRVLPVDAKRDGNRVVLRSAPRN
ncbi:MAG: hypothetical protein JWM91_4932 [Rhodospirillales bacterium]|nr:hypothetical protein [Rhodospirillales bacterium]